MSFTSSTPSINSSPLGKFYSEKGLLRFGGLSTRKQRLCSISCELQKPKKDRDRGLVNIDIRSDEIKISIHRRNVLLGIGGLCSAAASTVLEKLLPVDAGDGNGIKPKSLGEENEAVVMQDIVEFGSMARALTKVVHVLVDRPKNDGDWQEVLIVDGINILSSNKSVRFDVYVDKPVQGHGGLIFMENPQSYGEIVGSMVDIARERVGGNASKSSLEIGISALIEDIDAEDLEKLVVTLVPRSGLVVIGGVRIEAQ